MYGLMDYQKMATEKVKSAGQKRWKKKWRMKEMRKGTAYIKQKISDGVRKTGAFFSRHREVSGVTVIEMVLILVILIALLLIFKNQLVSLINTIFDKITSESSGI